ncbi:MAG: cation-translocating P-type ATPase [Oscillospiraceae bacterium]|nr:cation-translocating P-type ATPase [Oscillospiraceae bacterium]
MTDFKTAMQGLTTEKAAELLAVHGKNELTPQKKESLFLKALEILREPMFLLLLGAATVYFVLKEPVDGSFMLGFVVCMIGIEVYQEWKTDKTLAALKNLAAPRVRAMRDGQECHLPSAELVPGDLIMIEEGVKIPADGFVLKASDLCVDESSLTGESQGVWKTCRGDYQTPATSSNSGDYWRKDYCYAGTLTTQGSGYILVDKTGADTEYGKIGEAVAEAPDRPTPLEKQIGRLVRLCAVIAGTLFFAVGVITWFNTSGQPWERFTAAVLSSITLAMSLLPEELPVVLTVFLSMGAWRLAKRKALIKKLPCVETLGAVSVLCVDKTGTITQNRMSVNELYAPGGDTRELCELMGLGCETEAYDPMERAMLDYCEQMGVSKEHLESGELLKEYAFTNRQKMMGHVWRHEGELIIAAKGSPERLLELCVLTPEQRANARAKAEQMSSQGQRVIAVGDMRPELQGNIPELLQNCRLTFRGLVGLADPPRETVGADIAQCQRAGIRVVMITGDNGLTAASIASQIGMNHHDKVITGDQLSRMSDEQLRSRVRDTGVFSRVLPEHKMRIVKALRENGEVVAMTGDGVNDAPALKYADIGIAMGERGSEVSREAADMVLMDDNFSTIVSTVRDGRRIYDNIRKAVGYVFTIHIPIALASLLAPLLNIAPENLMLFPLQVVLLELVIDPTCSVVLERQPPEPDILTRPPRPAKEQILTPAMLLKSVVQGLAVFAASFGLYYFTLMNSGNAGQARAMGLVVLMTANLFLVQVNSSNREFVLKTAVKLLRDKVMWVINLTTAAGVLLILYTPMSRFFYMEDLPPAQLLLAITAGGVSVLWYEVVKFIKRRT